MNKTIIAGLTSLLMCTQLFATDMTCSEEFEIRVERQKDALPAKAVMLTLATVFAFPVGFSASSVEAKNSANVISQAKAFRVIKEAYSGAGANLDNFAHDVNKQLEEKVAQNDVANFLIDYDQSKFCDASAGFPTRQMPFHTLGEMKDHAIDHFEQK